MNRISFKSTILIFVAVFMFGMGASCQTQSTETWTIEKATKWFNDGEWGNGLKLKAHESVDKVEFATQYHKNKALWDKAMAYLKNTNLDSIAVGKYPIEGDALFATVTENPTKDFDQTKWESHKKYIDIQYIIRGKEKMGIAPQATATVTTPYDETKDVANYSSNEGKFFEAVPGTFFIFFPRDAHRPNTKIEGCDRDKKIVLKIRVK